MSKHCTCRAPLACVWTDFLHSESSESDLDLPYDLRDGLIEREREREREREGGRERERERGGGGGGGGGARHGVYRQIKTPL